VAVDSALHFTDSPMDGPFQLFNALRRLSAGQRFGGTFQFFHGPGIPYLHLLPFYLFGRDLVASEMARQLVSIVVALAVLAAFFRAWTGSWREGIPFTIAGLLLMIALQLNALLFPINSMLGLRSTMPLIVALHLYLRPAGWRAALERGALLAVTMTCGIDQGAASIGAYLVIVTALSVRRRSPRELLTGVATVLFAALVFLLILLLITPHGVGSVLRYNFRSLPADQFWYFGGPPNRFLFRRSQLVIFTQHMAWTVGVIGMVAWTLGRFWINARRSDDREVTAEAFLAVYAVASTASMLGVLAAVYFQPAARVALILALLAARREWMRRRDRLPISSRLRERAPVCAMVTTVVLPFLTWPLPTVSLIRTPLHLIYAHGYLRDGPTMMPEWSSAIHTGDDVVKREQQRLQRAPIVWSTYSSYLEWQLGVFNPSFDYIIHALGPENRAAYAATFAKQRPDVVQTIAPTFTDYEEWLEVNHWEFYRPLLRDYAIAGVGPWSYFWVRQTTSFDEHPSLIADSPVPPGRLALAIDGRGIAADSIGLFEVTLSYHVVNPLRRVPVVGSLPRYLVQVLGAANHFPISLAPYATKRTFPVVTVGPTEIHLVGGVAQIVGNASLVFDSIRVERLSIAGANRRWAADFVRGPINPDSLPGAKRP
jgi:hypothetical protein